MTWFPYDFTSDFIDGRLNAVSTHIALLGVTIAAEIAVAVGIVLESHPKTIREYLGMWLVLCGVFIGVVFTVLLFIFDEGISRTQQIQITELNQAALAASHKAEILAEENLKLQMALLPRKVLVGNEITGLQELALAPKANVQIEAIPDWEATTLAREIKFVLERYGHWNVQFISKIPVESIEDGVVILTPNESPIDPGHPTKMSPSLKALYDVLCQSLGPRAPDNLGVRWYEIETKVAQAELGGFVMPPNKIVVVIGARPLDWTFPINPSKTPLLHAK